MTQPGVIVHLTLQGADATRPDRVVITKWCSENVPWEYYVLLGGAGQPLERCVTGEPDSSVGLYFDPQSLAAGKTRTLITYYGLGDISSTKTGNPRMSLTFNQVVQQGDSFWITALVADPKAGQKITLELPAGLGLDAGYPAEQPIAAGGAYTQNSWRVIARSPVTDGAIKVTLQPEGISESSTITVQAKGITR